MKFIISFTSYEKFFLISAVLFCVLLVNNGFEIPHDIKSEDAKALRVSILNQTNTDCDCGENSISCKLVNGEKICTCKIDFAQKFSKCESCYCGPFSESCEFERILYQKCHCKKGYAEKYINDYTEQKYCIQCDCGSHSTGCEYESGQYQICSCEPGYSPIKMLDGEHIECRECDCGKNSTSCELNYNLKTRKDDKVCTCKSGYVAVFDTNSKITCQKCDCGPNSNYCEKSKDNYISCSCAEGYYSKERSATDKNQHCVSEPKKWQLPTFIVLGVLGILALGGVTFCICKRKRR